ncbi:MAG: flagellar biosynthetic protein FliO [Caulobacteraceae bacterium]|nr:flagellar biosynthetic protein FliO [Caulobacteraceae bacterium]
MIFADIVRMFFGLAVTLGLMGLVVVGLRRFGPETIRRLQGTKAERRLAVLETLVLDPARRLVLVRIDAEERLILLGEGRLLSAAPLSPTASACPTEEPAR